MQIIADLIVIAILIYIDILATSSHRSQWISSYSKDSKVWFAAVTSTQKNSHFATPGSNFRSRSRLTTQKKTESIDTLDTLLVFGYFLCYPLFILLILLASYFLYLYWCLHSFASLPCPFVLGHRVACCGDLVESHVCLQAHLDLCTTIRF